MPLLVMKIIFQIVPQQAPWILSPLLRFVFNKLSTALVDPRLAVHANYVSINLTTGDDGANVEHVSQIEEHLKKRGKWFAGGEEPTAADFMMSFPLETWASGRAGGLGDNILAYVKRVHER